MTDGVKPSIFLCVPAYGGDIITETCVTLIQLVQCFMQNGIRHKVGTISFPDIDEVRNIFCTIFYDKTDYTHVLMIDGDMSFEPQLIMDMIEFDKPIVGVIPTKKKYPLEFVGRAAKEFADEIVHNGFIKVDGVGAGVLLFTRECISEMIVAYQPSIIDRFPIDKHPASSLMLEQGLTRLLRPFEPIVEMEIGRLSEDLSFSQRWRRMGGEIWANVTHPIGHIGRHEFRGRYLDLIEMRSAQRAEELRARIHLAVDNVSKEATQ